jgi:hypothetical protein
MFLLNTPALIVLLVIDFGNGHTFETSPLNRVTHDVTVPHLNHALNPQSSAGLEEIGHTAAKKKKALRIAQNLD